MTNCSVFISRDGIVTTKELFEAIQKLRNAPDEAKTMRLLEVLDRDADGEIELEELRRVLFISFVLNMFMLTETVL